MEDLLKQQSVQTMVHDMRTPMTVLKGNLLLLLNGVAGQMSGDQLMILRRSMGPLEDLIQMTENMMQAVTLDKDEILLQFAKSDLDQMLAELLDFYQLPFKQRDIRFFRDGNSFGAQMMIDPFWVKRVLHNLVWNAFKFTPDEGQVSLHVHHRTDGGLQLAIQDTGRGIPQEKLETIFDKFSQAAPTSDRRLGSGLGLWICKRVMQLHGGKIHAESANDQGSRFVLDFPASRII
jgi:signal transduction histidine kinase